MSIQGIFGKGQVVESNYLRQLDVLRPDQTKGITILGTGAIGSAVGVFGGKVGVQNITLLDGDRVERHNIPNQYFGYEHIGKFKAEALHDEIMRHTPDNMQPLITYYDEMFTEESIVHTPIVMMCVDGLDTRKMVFNRLRQLTAVQWVIDVRMGARYYEIHSIDMCNEDDCERYLKTTEEEAMEAPCTNRAVIYTVAIAAGHAVNWMTMLMRDEPIPYLMYDDLTNYTFKRVIGWRK